MCIRDRLQISDRCCPPTGRYSNLRVSNLAYYSNPLDVLLADGRVIYADVRFKETTSYKRIRPGTYEFFFAETNLTPPPFHADIETDVYKRQGPMRAVIWCSGIWMQMSLRAWFSP